MGWDSLRLKVEEFHRRGFLIVPEALPRDVVSELNQGLDDYLQRFPDEWVKLSESLVQTVDVLPRTAAFDIVIENSRTLDIMRALLGEVISFEELSLMIRNPSAEIEDVKSWHRDIIRDFDRRMEIQAISLIYYLTDVTENDHCFSIIPESHNRLVDLKPADVSPGLEEDLIGPAGTAIIFHARCLHAGKLKSTSRPRRTAHVYYGRSDQPRTSEWTAIPPRLYEKADPSLPPFLYSKWNMHKVVEGTGKKPRDVDASLSAAEMLRIVQARAREIALHGKVGSDQGLAR